LVSSVRDPRAYELMVIIVPDISDEEVAEGLGRINTYIGDINGSIKEVLTDSPWGRRRLAYPIRFNSIDYRDGYYAVYHFDSRPDVMTDLERELKLDTRVIRYLLVHDDPKAGVQSANVPAEGSEEEADRDRDRRRPSGEDGRRPASERTRPVAAQAQAPAPAPVAAPAAESVEAPATAEAEVATPADNASAPAATPATATAADTETAPATEPASAPAAVDEVTAPAAEAVEAPAEADAEVVAAAPEETSKES